jgi:hypothetical protein
LSHGLAGLVVVVAPVGVLGVEAGFVAGVALGVLLVVVVGLGVVAGVVVVAGLVVVVVVVLGRLAPGAVVELVVVLVAAPAWPPDGVALEGLGEPSVVGVLALAAGAPPPTLLSAGFAVEDAPRPPGADRGEAANPGEPDSAFPVTGDDDACARGLKRCASA